MMSRCVFGYGGSGDLDIRVGMSIDRTSKDRAQFF